MKGEETPIYFMSHWEAFISSRRNAQEAANMTRAKLMKLHPTIILDYIQETRLLEK